MNHKQDKLIKNIEKKCTTIMIGALARFEDNFGYLWEEEGDAESDLNHNKWQNVRSNILNFGNHQIRAAVEELYRYFLENKHSNGNYNYEFNLNKKGDNK